MAPRPHTPNRRDFLRSLLGIVPAVLLEPALACAGPARTWKEDAPLDFLTADMPVIPRARWNPIEPNPRHLSPASPWYRITVHHAGMSVNLHRDRETVAEDLRRITLAHQARGYGDIAYHFVVDYVGRLWEARSLDYEGAHVYSANEGNIGIMLLGNFELQAPSLPQLLALERLVDLLRRRFAVDAAQLFGHCDLGPTLCPGKLLYPFVRRLREEA